MNKCEGCKHFYECDNMGFYEYCAESKVIGIMLLHGDGDREYYEPDLTPKDVKAIFEILQKYGDDNESIRGDLKVFDLDEYLPFS